MIVGAPFNDDSATNSGSAYIYKRYGASWRIDKKVVANDPAQDDYYGISVAIDNDYIAVGAPRKDASATDQGIIYVIERKALVDAGSAQVYNYDGTSWNQIGQTLYGKIQNADFGSAVSINNDGSRIAIGEPDNGNGNVRIYDYSNSLWVQLGSDIGGENSGDALGVSLSLDADGDRVIIGAEGNDDGGSDAGHTRIYEYDGTNWNQLGSDIDGEAAGDKSGSVVSIDDDGDRVAIGAYQNDGGGTGSGHVRVYEYSSGSWSQLGSDIDGDAAGDEFGDALSLDADGSHIAIGGVGNDENGSNAGYARVMKYNGNRWREVGYNLVGDEANDFAGADVSLNNNGRRIAIGAPGGAYAFLNDPKDETPAIISSYTLAADNSYIDVTMNEKIYSTIYIDGDYPLVSGGIDGTDGSITLIQNSGNATAGELLGIKANDNTNLLNASALNGGEFTLRLFLSITGLPSGTEQIYLVPNENSIFDPHQNPLPTTPLGPFTLNDMFSPTIISTTIADDNRSISVTFSEAVYASINQSGSLEASDFSLSILGGIATIGNTPTSISISGNVYTLGISVTGSPTGDEVITVVPSSTTAIYDASDNAASTTQSNNTVALNERISPVVTFFPLNGSIGVALNTNITLTFNEPIRHVDNNEITDSSVDALLRLKTPIHSGTDIPFDATIDADKKVITINPTSDLAYTQTVWVGIGESVEDTLNNAMFSAAASFTATDTNRTPKMSAYGNQTTFEDVAITLILMATDLDNDIVSFSVTSSESNVTPLITDSLLTLTPALNWHGQSTITVTATDNNETPSSQVKTFTLTVRPVNDAPTGVTFSPDSIRENLFPGTFVGTILATDIDTGETFIYDMVSGDGVNDRDNDKFLIVNDSLVSNAVFDYEEEDTLFIRLLVRDSGGLTSELSTEVYVIDTPDPILAFSATTLSYGKVIITQSSTKTLTLSSTGTDTVIIDSISQVGGAYSMSAQTYPIKIAPNLTKDFTFTFAPIDTGNSVAQAIFYPKYITGLNRVVLDGRAVHDTLPPMIATSAAITSAEAQDIVITVPVVDDNIITKVTLHHLVGGNATLYSQEATSNGDGTYSATIGKDYTSILGLAYYHTAEDEYSNIGISDTSAIEVKYVAGKLDSKIAGTAYPNGVPKDKWRLISVPTNLDFKTVNETLGDELGEEGKYSWKLYEDLGNANWQETQDIKLGNGYWLNQRTEDNLSFGVSSGKSVDIRSYLIPIPKGWSLIGNPYPFPVKVDFNDSEVFGPLTYGASNLLGDEYEGWDAETNTLKPWEGYAVYNRTSDSLYLEINPLAEDAVSSSAVTDGWHINLGVDNGKFSDHYNIIGRRSGASDKLDQWDNPEPPKLEEYLSLSMDRKEWGVDSPLTSDIRSMKESNGQWDMYLDTKGIKGTVYMEVHIKGDFPLESNAVLFDPVERKTYDLLMDQSIMITRVNDHYDYPLTVLVGSPDYVLAKTEALIAQLPEAFTLGQNYPNPFNPETNIPFTIAAPSYVEIGIFNLMGQRVATLESRWFDMGQYSVRWNGKDAQGNQLSTGVYIYSLESAQFRQAKKLILVK